MHPTAPAAPPVSIIVHARGATVRAEGDLRLTCEAVYPGGAAHALGTRPAAARHGAVQWNELLVLDAPADAALQLALDDDGGRRRGAAALDIGALVPFRAYTVDLAVDGGDRIRATVEVRDDATDARSVATAQRIRLELDAAAADGVQDAVCVASVVDKRAAARVVAALSAAPPAFPRAARLPDVGEDGVPIDDDALQGHRKPTLFAPCARRPSEKSGCSRLEEDGRRQQSKNGSRPGSSSLLGLSVGRPQARGRAAWDQDRAVFAAAGRRGNPPGQAPGPDDVAILLEFFAGDERTRVRRADPCLRRIAATPRLRARRGDGIAAPPRPRRGYFTKARPPRRRRG